MNEKKIRREEMSILAIFTLTAFEPSGKKIIDETFEAESETEAKEKGIQLLKEKEVYEKKHRCVSSTGKLILFK